MSEFDPNDELRTLFARQRSADHERAPGFGAVRARARHARTTDSLTVAGSWIWTGCGLATVAMVLATMLVRRNRAQPPHLSREVLAHELAAIDVRLHQDLAAQRSLTAWQAPTDFLLQSTTNQTHP